MGLLFIYLDVIYIFIYLYVYLNVIYLFVCLFIFINSTIIWLYDRYIVTDEKKKKEDQGVGC